MLGQPPFDPRSKSARRRPRPFSRRPVAVAAHDALARPVPWQGSSSRGGRRRARRGSSESVAESCCHGRGELLPRRATERGCHATARPLAPSDALLVGGSRFRPFHPLRQTLLLTACTVRRCVDNTVPRAINTRMCAHACANVVKKLHIVILGPHVFNRLAPLALRAANYSALRGTLEFSRVSTAVPRRLGSLRTPPRLRPGPMFADTCRS